MEEFVFLMVWLVTALFVASTLIFIVMEMRAVPEKVTEIRNQVAIAHHKAKAVEMGNASAWLAAAAGAAIVLIAPLLIDDRASDHSGWLVFGLLTLALTAAIGVGSKLLSIDISTYGAVKNELEAVEKANNCAGEEVKKEIERLCSFNELRMSKRPWLQSALVWSQSILLLLGVATLLTIISAAN